MCQRYDVKNGSLEGKLRGHHQKVSTQLQQVEIDFDGDLHGDWHAVLFPGFKLPGFDGFNRLFV